MGLKGDISEVIATWSNSSWWMRAWLVLSAYLAVSSIASLSETFVKWKGFILDGVLFYQRNVRFPIRNLLTPLLAPLNLHLSVSAHDAVVMATVVNLSFMRAHMLSAPELAVAGGKEITKIRSWTIMIVFSLISLACIIVTDKFSFVDPIHFVIVFNVVSIAYLSLISKFIAELTPAQRKATHKIIKWYCVQICMCMMFLGLLAAINKGLYG